MFSIHNTSAEIICRGPCRGRAALRLPAAPLLLMEKNIASCRDMGWRQGVLPSAQNCWLIWPATGLVVPLLVPLVLHRHHRRRLRRKLAPRDMPYVARRNPSLKLWASLVPPMDLSAIHRGHRRSWSTATTMTMTATKTTTTTTMRTSMTARPVGTNAWSFSAASETPLHPPWSNSSHLL